MESHLLTDVVIILGLSLALILIFQKLKLPPIIGFLVAGIIAGPYGLSLIEGPHEVELMAEIGVVFLLFAIGLEFSVKTLVSIKRTVFLGGTVQVGLTIAISMALSMFLGFGINEALFIGFLLSLSSTAIVLKMLQERGELATPQGRASVGILLFQDIIVVPMILITPFLAGEAQPQGGAMLMMVVKMVATIVVLILMARYIIPLLFEIVVKTRNRELFVITTVVLCFATAWLTSYVGLSLALGAFFAGLILSGSEYSHQAKANIYPFREIFLSFFFVSIGMLLDLRFFINNLLIIHSIAIGVIVIKMITGFAASRLSGTPRLNSVIAGLNLFQVGEFAFMLSAIGLSYGLLEGNTYQYFLSVSIITMGATPFIINGAPKIAKIILKAPLPDGVRRRISRIKRKEQPEIVIEENCHDHLVIVGYGLNGENVANAALLSGIPYVVIEHDSDVYKKAKASNFNAILGDATDESLLRHINIHESRVVVVAISDPTTTREVVKAIRSFTETAHIIVRTKYMREVEENLKLGADDVIPEEFETSIEIFTHVLRKYLVPHDEIQEFVDNCRTRNYEYLRNIPSYHSKKREIGIHIPDMEISTIPVQNSPNSIIGKSISESGLRTEFGITVLAIRRGDKYISEISPDITIEQDDILYLFGSPGNISKINKYLLFRQ